MQRSDPIVGGLYGARGRDGRFSIVKVLAVDESAVHLRRYANQFAELPTTISSSDLTLGSVGSPDGFGIGHYPIAREAFDREERTLIAEEVVDDDELEGYRIWAGDDEA